MNWALPRICSESGCVAMESTNRGPYGHRHCVLRSDWNKAHIPRNGTRFGGHSLSLYLLVAVQCSQRNTDCVFSAETAVSVDNLSASHCHHSPSVSGHSECAECTQFECAMNRKGAP